MAVNRSADLTIESMGSNALRENYLYIIRDIFKIEKNCFEDGIRYDLNHFYPWLARSADKKVVLIKNARAKYIAYMEYFLHDNKMHIGSIAVHPIYQGKKFGEWMIESALTKEIKVEKIYLECRPNLETYYKQYDFKTINIRRDYYHIQPSKENASHPLSLSCLIMEANKASVLEKIHQKQKFSAKQENNFYGVKENDENNLRLLDLLIIFCKKIKKKTSLFYENSFFNRHDKEEALEVILEELIAMKSNYDWHKKSFTQSRFTDILRAILAHSFRQQGMTASQINDFEIHHIDVPITISGNKAINLLNEEAFIGLKHLISETQNPLSYKEVLNNFVGPQTEIQMGENVFKLNYFKQSLT